MDEQAGATGATGPARWRTARVLLGLAAAAVVGGVVVGGGAGAAVVAAGGATDLEVWDPFGRSGPLDPDEEIDGVVTVDDLSLQHREGRVDYEQHPPVGGDHAPVWQNCGFYDSAVLSEQAVHSLEHGAVWVTFDPDLPADEVDRLRELAGDNGFLLVSPMVGLPSPVVASAWGVQLELPSADDRRLPAFVARYQQGPQTPEPGAPCSGGTSALPDPPTGA